MIQVRGPLNFLFWTNEQIEDTAVKPQLMHAYREEMRRAMDIENKAVQPIVPVKRVDPSEVKARLREKARKTPSTSPSGGSSSGPSGTKSSPPSGKPSSTG